MDMNSTVNTDGIPAGKLDRIRALLAKAESTEFEAERESLSNKAAELMAKYAVDEAMLAVGKPAADDPVEHRTIVIANPYIRPKAHLLNSIALNMGIALVLSNGTAHVFGHRSDLERMDWLYTSLLIQASRGAMAARPARAGESVRTVRADYFLGFAARIRQRMEEAHESAVAAHTGTGAELALVDRSKAVDAATREMFPHTRSGSVRGGRTSGFANGAAAGGRADIGNRRLGGQSRALTR